MSSGIITDKALSIYGTVKIKLIFLIVFGGKRDKFYLIEKRSSFCLVVISSSYHMSTENCRKIHHVIQMMIGFLSYYGLQCHFRFSYAGFPEKKLEWS